MWVVSFVSFVLLSLTNFVWFLHTKVSGSKKKKSKKKWIRYAVVLQFIWGWELRTCVLLTVHKSYFEQKTKTFWGKTTTLFCRHLFLLLTECFKKKFMANVLCANMGKNLVGTEANEFTKRVTVEKVLQALLVNTQSRPLSIVQRLGDTFQTIWWVLKKLKRRVPLFGGRCSGSKTRVQFSSHTKQPRLFIVSTRPAQVTDRSYKNAVFKVGRQMFYLWF